MIHFQNYIKPQNLEEAYQLNQKKSAVIAGGFCFLRMQNRSYSTLIDLSDLLSDQIEETEEAFVIGAGASLRTLEIHEGLHSYTCGGTRDALKHIVGVQFRNCAQVGASIFSRFGFSDVLTLFLSMDSYVELYKGGRIPLCQFVSMKQERDILTAVIVKKKQIKAAYESMRNEAVDFPVLTVAVSEFADEKKTLVSIGARPAKARQVIFTGLLSEYPEAGLSGKMEEIASSFTYGSNLRGTGEYRRYLAGVLVGRAVSRIREINRQESGRI